MTFGGEGIKICWEGSNFSRRGWGKNEQIFGWWAQTPPVGKTLVAVISVDAYPFLAFSGLTCHLEDTGIGVFWLH